jgi:GNAT superfamily N-acetyltransferase
VASFFGAAQAGIAYCNDTSQLTPISTTVPRAYRAGTERGVFDLGEGYRLRRADKGDHAAMSLVCLRTGNAGMDATAREDDPELIGLIYAVPYQVHAPDFAFVIDGPRGVCGYVLGALDSESFYRVLYERWFPPIAARITDPGPDRTRWRGSDWARRMIHHPSVELPPALAAFPSHAHIDLLEPARGRGIGRRSLEFLMAALSEAGSPGMHVGVSPRNRTAQRFYLKLGLARIEDALLPQGTVFMAKRL